MSLVFSITAPVPIESFIQEWMKYMGNLKINKYHQEGKGKWTTKNKQKADLYVPVSKL